MVEKWPRDLWLDAIWEDEALKPNERQVAYVYGRYAGKLDTAWCSYDEIMRRTGMRNRRSVSAALRVLTEDGWLVEVERAAGRRSAVYRLTCPAEQWRSATATDEGAARSSGDSPPRDEDSFHVAVAISPPSSGDLHASSGDSAFQQWRFVHPREQIDLSDKRSEDLSEARQRASDPSGSPAAAYRRSPDEPHNFLESGSGGACQCGLPRGDDMHKPVKRPRAGARAA